LWLALNTLLGGVAAGGTPALNQHQSAGLTR
jgi:hypothetical protein